MITTLFDHLQQQDPFQFHLPNDGSNIGGKQPTNYGAVHQPDGSTLFYVEGGPYATAMLYGHSAWPTLSEGLQYTKLSMNIAFSLYGPNLLLELDTMLGMIGGKAYGNLSSQWRRYDPDNGKARLQVIKTSGPWVDVPNTDIAWPLAPGVHSITENYLFNVAAGTVTFVSYTLDGTTYLVNVTSPVNNVAWSAGPSRQCQLTAEENGGNCGITILDWSYTWS